MRCTRATYQLQLYIDHQLTLRQTRVLEAHVASCPACRAELQHLEAVTCGLKTLKFVAEPADMHEQIMQRVALSTARKQAIQKDKQLARFRLFQPSLTEILIAVLLATVATLTTLVQQLSQRALLPLPNTSGHNPFSLLVMQIVHTLTSINANALILAIWIVGAFLGILITLAVAGREMRTQWFKTMMERLPVR